MKILICLENLQMDGVKRAATVVGNELAKTHELAYYVLSAAPSFFKLNAPLLTSDPPIQATKSFREAAPVSKHQVQLDALIKVIAAQKFEIVILNAGLMTSFAPQLKAALPKVKLIAWMHNNYETYLTQYYKDMREEFVKGLETVDAIVTLTQSDWRKFKQHNRKTVKIHNPITLTSEDQSDLTLPIILSVCRLEAKQKGLDYLLGVAKYLPEAWQIQVAGSGPDETWLQNEIQKRELTSKVTLLGALTDTQLKQRYQRASLFLMTSRWEGLPLVIGEAMAFGLPIVSMWNTGAQEYLDDGRYGILIDDHDAKKLSQNMLPLMSSQALRQQMSALSLKRAADFRLPRIVKLWQALFDDLQAE